MSDDLCTPESLQLLELSDGSAQIYGGVDQQLWMATFHSRNAAEHFVRYCVEANKTFAGREI